MKNKTNAVAAVIIAMLPFAMSGCVVADDPDVVATPPRNVTVDTTRTDPPDVNINVKTPDIEIKQDPPPRSTTGF